MLNRLKSRKTKAFILISLICFTFVFQHDQQYYKTQKLDALRIKQWKELGCDNLPLSEQVVAETANSLETIFSENRDEPGNVIEEVPKQENGIICD